MREAFEVYADEIERGLSASEDWTEPEPFDEPKAAEFPRGALPAVLGTYLDALSESLQVPPEMPGTVLLGVLATCFQRRYVLQVKADWKEPLNLFLLAVAPPGERKSPVFGACFGPVFSWERERAELDRGEIARVKADRKLLEAQAENARKRAAADPNDTQKRREALDLAEAVARFEDTREIRLVTADATPEKLAALMEEQGGSITVASDEGGGLFDGLEGRYSIRPNIDVYLQGHAGQQIIVDRMGRESNRVSDPRLTMCLTCQPSVLNAFLSNPVFSGRGLCARFLIALCRSYVGNRSLDAAPVPGDVAQAYGDFVRSALGNGDRGILYLSGDAYRGLQMYFTSVEQRLAGEWDFMCDWGGKLVGHVARIAGLLHCAKTEHPTEVPVSGETMAQAVKLGEFFASNAASSYIRAGADETTADALYLWKKICQIGKAEFRERELFERSKGRFKTMDRLLSPLQTLIQMGYLRKLEQDKGGPGRKASPLLKVNPLSQYSQNSQK